MADWTEEKEPPVEGTGMAYSPSSRLSVVLVIAARDNHLDVVKYLLSRGVDVNGTGAEGRVYFWTPCSEPTL